MGGINWKSYGYWVYRLTTRFHHFLYPFKQNQNPLNPLLYWGLKKLLKNTPFFVHENELLINGGDKLEITV